MKSVYLKLSQVNIQKFSLLIFLAFFIAIFSNSTLAAINLDLPNGVPLIEVKYTVTAGETLTGYFYSVGIGTSDSPYSIYGRRGWLAQTKKMNPELQLEDFSTVGTEVIVLIPIEMFSRTMIEDNLRKMPNKLNGHINIDGSDVLFDIKLLTAMIPKNQTISNILFDQKLGRPGSPFKIYGKNGFLNLIKALNPDVKNCDKIPPHDPILLAYPIVPDFNNVEDTEGTISSNEPEAVLSPPIEEPQVTENEIATPSDEPPVPVVAPKEEIAEIKEETSKKDSRSFWQRLLGGSSSDDETAVEVGKEIPPSAEPLPPAIGQLEPPAPPKAEEKIEPIALDRPEFPSLRPRLDINLPAIEKPVLEINSRRTRKVNPEVKNKAWELSIFDAMKPGMEGVFQGVSASTASGYLGVRYGYSLAPKAEPLLPKVMFFGLLAELRDGVLDGVKIYFDKSPTVADKFDGQEISLGWQRFLLAYAFKFETPFLVDTIHVAPKLGRYTLNAKFPAAGAAPGSAPQSLNIAGALGTGIEVDLEVAKFWYIIRGWAAQDVSLGSKDRDSVVSRRFGLDLFVKGSGISLGGGGRLSVSYLGFYVTESIVMHGKVKNEKFNISIDNSYVGLGTSLSW